MSTDWDELRTRVASAPSEMCGNCAFGLLHTYSESMAVKCVRFPPQRLGQTLARAPADTGRADSAWPYTLLDDWCGEYQRKEVPDGTAA